MQASEGKVEPPQDPSSLLFGIEATKKAVDMFMDNRFDDARQFVKTQ